MSAGLRRAEPADVTRLAALEQEAFGADAWSSALIATEIAGRHGVVLVAEEAGESVGYASARRGGDVVDLLRIVVLPRCRRTGLATSLLEKLRWIEAAAGTTAVMLEVSATNTAAHAFYAAQGFAQIDRRSGYYKDGSDALVLRKEWA